MDERLAPPPWTVTGGTTWAAVLGGPLAWFASQQVSHGGPVLAIHFANLVALAIVVLAGWFSWREWRRAGPHISDERAPPEGRQRFLGMMGLTLSGLFGLVIVAQTTGAFFFGPCER